MSTLLTTYPSDPSEGQLAVEYALRESMPSRSQYAHDVEYFGAALQFNKIINSLGKLRMLTRAQQNSLHVEE